MRYRWQRLSSELLLGGLFLLGVLGSLFAASPQLAPVVPGKTLEFPQDFGAHPDFRIEWWYVTGWLHTETDETLGFQVTFFRTATRADEDNPSQFAPKQLIIAHVALSDPAVRKLQHDQKIARAGFDLAYAREGDTDVRLDDWVLMRETDGRYRTVITADDFSFQLAFAPTQPPMLQGDRGFSRKGPKMEQASYYYSEPHLQISGTIDRRGKSTTVTGTAWLDHEWSSELLDTDAAGWDWASANLDDGSALMAFQIRGKDGNKVWAHAALRNADGKMQTFAPEQVSFHPEHHWQSVRTQATYPVATRLKIDGMEWRITPLMNDQELDSRGSVGAVYWEGAVTFERDNQPVGRGYMELTGYVEPLSI